ncbi:hypothetical protein [Halobacteriovorax sp. YZS-1-1]|uniref:hypothetical protein n=1 Tax=unclassified Halobacteriovorax TaxID=2639665 RepID=UPI00399AE885
MNKYVNTMRIVTLVYLTLFSTVQADSIDIGKIFKHKYLGAIHCYDLDLNYYCGKKIKTYDNDGRPLGEGEVECLAVEGGGDTTCTAAVLEVKNHDSNNYLIKTLPDTWIKIEKSLFNKKVKKLYDFWRTPYESESIVFNSKLENVYYDKKLMKTTNSSVLKKVRDEKKIKTIDVIKIRNSSFIEIGLKDRTFLYVPLYLKDGTISVWLDPGSC